MFFTTELLSRRDSGFGLLWLAATLGAKSSFRKLPRRSVMTADISELCTLIAEPVEPLALRLSSNLMIGVARVYKVKQEILLTDVTTCFNTLKKVTQDMYAVSSAAAQLQMGQPSVRPDLVTAVPDPTVAFALDFDHLFRGWDEPVNTQAGYGANEEDESEEEYDPNKGRKAKKRGKAKASSISLAEQGRADLHTLQEDHSYLLSSSLDVALEEEGGAIPSSSQFGGFRFDDNFLDGVDLSGEIGEELARELGDAWGVSQRIEDEPLPTRDVEDVGMPAFDEGIDGQLQQEHALHEPGADAPVPGALSSTPLSGKGFVMPADNADNDDRFAMEGSVILPLSPLGSQVDRDSAVHDEQQKRPKKGKRVRLLLDARTELTNEELERARSSYLESQALLKRESEQKKAEKESARLIEEMIWGVPRGVAAPVLIDFWQENFRVQVAARSGRLHLITEGEPPKKRQRLEDDITAPEDRQVYEPDRPMQDANLDIDLAWGGGGNEHAMQDEWNMDSRMRSSEEPGQGRRASRPPSAFGSQFEVDAVPARCYGSGSQRSNFFPWDNAAVSSSVSGVAAAAPGGSDRLSFTHADSRLRGSSIDKDSITAGVVPESPPSLRVSASHRDNVFEFDVPASIANAEDSQMSDASVMTLERNSFNFLEYAKMQLNAFPSATSSLNFSDVVPIEASTRHVAAAAFYHCLVLTTKDLLRVKQEEPYGEIEIVIR